MKPLTKRLIESGLLDKHTLKMMERWGSLDHGSADMAGQKKVHRDGLEEFADELEGLLTEGRELRETRLDIRLAPPEMFVCPRQGNFAACKDELGRLIVSPKLEFNRGDTIYGHSWGPIQIIEVEPIYIEENIHALQLTLDI